MVGRQLEVAREVEDVTRCMEVRFWRSWVLAFVWSVGIAVWMNVTGVGASYRRLAALGRV